MQAINYTTARKELARTMDQVCQNHDPVIITRNNNCSVVIISLKDYESLQETEFLLRSPNNARRLMRAIEADRKGQGKCMTMDELEKPVNAKTSVHA